MQAEGLVVLGHIQWQLSPHPHQASMSQVLNLAAESSHNLNHFWPCRIHDRMLAFNATGNALTTVLAGFARTIVSLPTMILSVALVAGFLRVLILARPGMVNTPVFFTSAAPISPNEPKSLVTTLFFSSTLDASESARAPLVMAFAAAAFIPRGAMVIALRVSCLHRK